MAMKSCGQLGAPRFRSVGSDIKNTEAHPITEFPYQHRTKVHNVVRLTAEGTLPCLLGSYSYSISYALELSTPWLVQ
jgi:hypothetical protein